MESIIKCFQAAMVKPVPIVDLSSILAEKRNAASKSRGSTGRHPRSGLGRMGFANNQASDVPAAEMGARWTPHHRDSRTFLMAIVQTVSRTSYEQIVDYEASIQPWPLN